MANLRPESPAPASQEDLTQEREKDAPEVKGRPSPKKPRSEPGRQPGWVRVTPLFLSAILFLSGIFSVFCALPLQVLSLQKRWKLLLLSLVLNSAWVILLGGFASFALYAVYGLVPGVLLGWLMGRGTSLTRSLAVTVAGMMTVAGGVVLGVAVYHQVSPFDEVRNQVSVFLRWMEVSLAPEARENLLGGMDPKDWSKAFLHELPSALILFALAQAWLSAVFLLRANPGGILGMKGLKPDLIRNWRVPDLWVWPTIACAVFMVFEIEQVTPWATNAFRVLMGLYALQGLAILGAFLDAWKIRGFLRNAVYVGVLFLMMPLLLSVGFFDQWFDFRKKLRQST